MKNADRLDVVASLELITTQPAATWEQELQISVRGPVYTLRRLKNDRSRVVRLSKIAHK
jgi:hypothetical protein